MAVGGGDGGLLENTLGSESSIGSHGGFIVPVTPRTDFDASYTPIYNVQDLSNIRNDLSGNYYLANNIDFSTDSSGYDNGGIDVPLKVEVKEGNILEITIGTIGDTLADTRILFGSLNASALTAGIAETISDIPTTVIQTLVMGGILNSEPFAFSLEVDTSSVGLKFNGSFDSNGNFDPIGAFTGIFDGNGYTINGMHTAVYSSSGDVSSGLFSWVEESAQIKNLGVLNGSSVAASYTGAAYAGSIAGSAHRVNLDDVAFGSLIITNCYNTGSVAGSAAGGIVGNGFGSLTITNCYNTGLVTAYAYAGGIVGYAISHTGFSDAMTIADCYNTGSVTAINRYAYVGGIVGYTINSLTNPSSIINCNNAGTVTGSAVVDVSISAEAHVGGIVGYTIRTTITNCYNTGSITGSVTVTSVVDVSIVVDVSTITRAYVGGIVGCLHDNDPITNCYNTGSITGLVTAPKNAIYAQAYVGGIVGDTSSPTITNCYNTGSVTASGNAVYTGGIVGCTFYPTITNCYNTGSVTAYGSLLHVGGIVGYTVTLTITNCYNTGSVTASGDYSSHVGGLVGRATGTLTIIDSESTGSVTASGSKTSGSMGDLNIDPRVLAIIAIVAIGGIGAAVFLMRRR